MSPGSKRGVGGGLGFPESAGVQMQKSPGFKVNPTLTAVPRTRTDLP